MAAVPTSACFHPSSSEVTGIQVPTKTLLCSLHLQEQRGPPPPVGAAPAERRGWSPALLGTCPAPGSSTVQVFSISQLPCFVQFLLLGVFAVLSENMKIHTNVPSHSGNEEHLTVLQSTTTLTSILRASWGKLRPTVMLNVSFFSKGLCKSFTICYELNVSSTQNHTL